jgi:hypothetical protein
MVGLVCLTTLVDELEPILRWYFCSGDPDPFRNLVAEPALLWEGDLRCRVFIE